MTRMGRTGIEPVTLGLKVLHFDGNVVLKKRRFSRVFKPLARAVDSSLRLLKQGLTLLWTRLE